MQHSFNKIWVHTIWSTKGRLPLIDPRFEDVLFNFIGEQLREAGCPARIVDGMPDHVHCLFVLNPLRSISEIVKLVKGGSSHYLNGTNLTKEKFAWQKGYAAYSVSESQLEKAFHHIRNQKQFHQTKSFDNEFESLLRLNGFNPYYNFEKNG